jgi:hypothetical protein
MCPACGDLTAFGPFITILHLNDHHKWTREQIADWVQTIEDAQTPPLAVTEVRVPVSIPTAASFAQK